MANPTAPRIPPLPESEWDDKTRELLAVVGVPGAAASNIFTTLVRHPRLYERFLAYGGVLLTGALPARERELMILRTAFRCHTEYEWGQHVRIAAEGGISADEIARIQVGPDAPGWEAFDAVVLRAVDELHVGQRVSDPTWTALAARFDEHQLIEVPMLVGSYHMVAFLLNSLGVELEPGIAGFDD